MLPKLCCSFGLLRQVLTLWPRVALNMLQWSCLSLLGAAMPLWVTPVELRTLHIPLCQVMLHALCVGFLFWNHLVGKIAK